MTSTPIPRPVDGADDFALICNGCRKLLPLSEAVVMGWRRVWVDGWCGYFHACSDACEDSVKRMYTVFR